MLVLRLYDFCSSPVIIVQQGQDFGLETFEIQPEGDFKVLIERKNNCELKKIK